MAIRWSFLGQAGAAFAALASMEVLMQHREWRAQSGP